MENKLKVLDLFAGIGGFSLGLERTGGFETVGFCEIHPYAQKVLRSHWPEVPIYEDVETLKGEDVGQINIITGGFPCQDISLARREGQPGLDGKRSGLWSEILRLTGELRPEYVLVENVSNLLAGPSEQRGGWFGRILGDLAQIGYDAEWHCIKATYLGAWHERDRVWILAYPHMLGQQGSAKGPVLGQRHLSFQSLRSIEGWPGRSNLPAPKLVSANDGVSNRVDQITRYGNAIYTWIATAWGYAILEDFSNAGPQLKAPA